MEMATDIQEIRLQKFIASLGMMSRREAEAAIAAKKVFVDGRLATVGLKVNPYTVRELKLNGSIYNLEDGALNRPHTTGALALPKVYWILNKPDKTLVSRANDQGYQSIFDLKSLAKIPFQVSPVGRLDYRTEGLLLLTNDGDLVYRLTHPKYKVPRRYQVLLNRRLTSEELKSIRKGIDIGESRHARGEIQFLQGESLGKSTGAWYQITVHEGRNRLVRRIFSSLEAKVVRLVRVAFGDLHLPLDLEPGTYRQLTSKEIHYLKKSTSDKNE